MKHCNTVLGQLLTFVPKKAFDQLTGQHQSDHRSRRMTAWQQLILLLYCQAAGKESLRDLETSLLSQQSKLYHLGLESVARSTFSDANNRRDPVVYESLFYQILEQIGDQIPNKSALNFENDCYALDGSLISLSLSLFDWAKYRTRKGASRIHTLTDVKKDLPVWLNITDGKKHETQVAKEHWSNWNLAPGSILLFDRGYIDYQWWYELNQARISWITRAKSNLHFFPEVNTETQVREFTTDHPHVISDQNGYLIQAEDKYPELIRRVEYYDELNDKTLVFLTNNFALAPEQIAEAYKARWRIESFFKWIKQNLKIKTFIGTSHNAVASQIWVAMIYYLILAYIKAKTKLKQSMLSLSRIFNTALLERVHIIELFYSSSQSIQKLANDRASPQLSLC